MAYCDIAFAAGYFADRIYSEAWQNAGASDQSAALATATGIIRDFCVFMDAETGEPFVYDENDSDRPVPDWLKNATCEEALYLLNLSRDPAFDKKLTLGIYSTDGTVFSKDFRADVVCLICRRILKNNGGTLADGAAAGGSVSAGRIFK